MKRTYPGRNKSTGTVLFIVIVCLVVASTVLLGAVSFSIRHRAQLKMELQLEQTYWLLDAGIGKAIDQFQRQPNFEDLTVSITDPLKDYDGSIEIAVVDDNQESIRVRVTAQLVQHNSLNSITKRSRLLRFDKRQFKKDELEKDKTKKDDTVIRETENDDEQ